MTTPKPPKPILDTKTPDELPEARELSATDLVDVENISNRNICLTNTILKPGDKGVATFAEYTTLAQFLERV